MTAPIELDLDALVAAAEAAGSDRWQQLSNRPSVIHPVSPSFDCICTVQTSNVENWPDIAAFIAAANPAVVLDLVRRLRAAEAMVAARVEEVSAALDEDAMRAAGWVRAEKTIPAPPPIKPEPKCKECGDEMCGGTGIYEFRKCDGIPF